MSGTETILLIVLGFSLASVLSLFAGRMLWMAGVRVGARRMQRQVPSSLAGLQTERDRLRAEYAMLAQRLGSRLEDAKLSLAESMAEVSRHRNRIHHVETGEAGRNAEIRQLQKRVKQLEAALADSKSLEKEIRIELAAKEEAYRRLRRKKVDALPDDPEIRLRQRIGKLSELARADAVAIRLAEAERQTSALESELNCLDAEWPAASAAATATATVIPLPNRTPDTKIQPSPMLEVDQDQNVSLS